MNPELNITIKRGERTQVIEINQDVIDSLKLFLSRSTGEENAEHNGKLLGIATITDRMNRVPILEPVLEKNGLREFTIKIIKEIIIANEAYFADEIDVNYLDQKILSDLIKRKIKVGEEGNAGREKEGRGFWIGPKK